jgi:hypothetical protein
VLQKVKIQPQTLVGKVGSGIKEKGQKSEINGLKIMFRSVYK